MGSETRNQRFSILTAKVFLKGSIALSVLDDLRTLVPASKRANSLSYSVREENPLFSIAPFCLKTFLMFLDFQ